jgi:hypothetical protein
MNNVIPMQSLLLLASLTNAPGALVSMTQKIFGNFVATKN